MCQNDIMEILKNNKNKKFTVFELQNLLNPPISLVSIYRSMKKIKKRTDVDFNIINKRYKTKSFFYCGN